MNFGSECPSQLDSAGIRASTSMSARYQPIRVLTVKVWRNERRTGRVRADNGSSPTDWVSLLKTPSATPGFSGVNLAAIVVAGGLAHTCAIADSGGAFCWGSNSSGQLGTGSPAPLETQPVHVLGLSGVQRLALGATHSCAQTSDGVVYCWGNNFNAQVGADQGGTYLAPRPIQ